MRALEKPVAASTLTFDPALFTKTLGVIVTIGLCFSFEDTLAIF